MSFETEKHDLSNLRINHAEAGVQSRSGNRRRMVYGAAAVAGLVIVALIIFYSSSFSTQYKVEVGTVSLSSPAQANAVLTASGYVVAERKAAVASKGTGRLEYLAVEEGDHVKKGSIIGRLESSDVEAALGQARANLGEAKAAGDQAKVELDDATANFDRQKSLFASKLISQADYDVANARYKRAIAGVSLANAAVDAAQAGVRSAEVAVENTYIRAPFDGVVLTKDANVGEVITPFGAASGSRGDIVTMADMSSLEVEADVSESYISRIDVGQACTVTLDAVPDHQYGGHVHKIVPTADRAKATVLTKVRFDNRDDRVLPEMSAKVLFLSPSTKKADLASAPVLTVPASAITTREGKSVVFLVSGSSVRQTNVVLGGVVGNGIEVKEGLSAGDRVVLHPSQELKDGSKVALPQ